MRQPTAREARAQSEHRGLKQSQMIGDDFERLARQIQAAAQDAGRALEPFLKSLAEPGQGISEAFQRIVLQVQEIQAQIAPSLDRISRALQDLPERNQKGLRILAANGWYLDPHFSIPGLFEVADLFEAGEADRANEKLCEHFDSRLNDIEANVCNRFSTRARILRQAFGAHRRGEYALSVPVFLAQADGICKDLVGVQLYARRNGMPALAACLTIETLPPLEASLLCPLIEPNPMSASADERAAFVDLLNRHAVLHGESLEYDTRVNSCRSVSLLIYVTWVLQ